MALSSIADCRCAPCQRDRGEGDHERRSHAPALADAMGAREGYPDHVPWRNPRSFVSSIDGLRPIGRTPLKTVMESSGSGSFRAGALPLNRRSVATALPSPRYLANDDWIILACSICATKAGRTLPSNAFNSAFCALGIRVLSIASITAW